MFEKEQPDSETIALAIVSASTSAWGEVRERLQSALQAHLQLRLTVEHIAAQREMTRASDRLASASWGLAAVGVLLAIVTYWKTFWA